MSPQEKYFRKLDSIEAEHVEMKSRSARHVARQKAKARLACEARENATPLPLLLEQLFERWKLTEGNGHGKVRNRNQAGIAFFFGRLRKLISEHPETLSARAVVVALRESIEYAEL